MQTCGGDNDKFVSNNTVALRSVLGYTLSLIIIIQSGTGTGLVQVFRSVYRVQIQTIVYHLLICGGLIL